jgi:mitogen-activated protein kinase kinase
MAALPHARGNVFTARLRGTPDRCVLKRFAALGAAGDGVGVFLNELRVLRQLDEHPNVIALEAAVWDRATSEVFLQFPFVEGGALPQWLAAAPRSWADRLRLFRGVVQGVAYLHSKKIVHRSVSPLPFHAFLVPFSYTRIKRKPIACLKETVDMHSFP